MRFVESLSVEREADKAVEGVCRPAEAGLRGDTADLGFLFFSRHHVPRLSEIVRGVRTRTGVRTLLGCLGETVVGGGREVEREPALALFLAALPGADVRPVRLSCRETMDGFAFPLAPEGALDDAEEGSLLLFLGDPFTLPVDLYLRRFNEDHPGVLVVGGMASGGRGPGETVLLHDGQPVRDGAVGYLLRGVGGVRTVVSQGCRPVGEPLVVTECDRNSILRLGGKPALARIQDLFSRLSEEDRRLFQAAPHLGVVMREGQERFGPGDFLIRNLVGVDPAHGAVFVSDYLRRGQTIQFHVRDGRAADEDLRALLARDVEQHLEAPARAALLFSCNGRGQRLFGRPDHDVAAVRAAMGEIPVSGFFAQGEVGPVSGRNYLHGFTASIALFAAT